MSTEDGESVMEINRYYKTIGLIRTGNDRIMLSGWEVYVTDVKVTGYNTRITFQCEGSEDYLDLPNEFYGSEPEDAINHRFELVNG